MVASQLHVHPSRQRARAVRHQPRAGLRAARLPSVHMRTNAWLLVRVVADDPQRSSGLASRCVAEAKAGRAAQGQGSCAGAVEAAGGRTMKKHAPARRGVPKGFRLHAWVCDPIRLKGETSRWVCRLCGLIKSCGYFATGGLQYVALVGDIEVARLSNGTTAVKDSALPRFPECTRDPEELKALAKRVRVKLNRRTR